MSYDLCSPEMLYPRARLWRRKVIFHGGPTNSGKTFQSLEALKKAETGIYAGPLRLLAVEIYERLNREGAYCSLFTGQERREVPFASHASCTIEMLPVQMRFEVAVIDEIQMMASHDRGHAWTRAFLGVDAAEVHTCGSLDAANLVERLCERTGDIFKLKTYDRLTPLEVEKAPVDDWKDLRKGDCVVTFSRKDIHKVRAAISGATGMRCGVVYGQLPPETRSHQAKLFNDATSKCDILVASDAIGMGLNLNIRRVLFQATRKFARHKPPPPPSSDDDDEDETKDHRMMVEKSIAPVEPALVKQIAGRAGRKNTRFEGGLVGATNEEDLSYVRQVLETPQPPVLEKAGIFPSAEMLAIFARERGHVDKPLNVVISAFAKACNVDDDLYFVSGHDEISSISENLTMALEIHKLASNLPVDDALVFCNAPCNTNDRFALSMLASYAAAHYDAVILGKPTRIAPNVRIPPRPPSSLNDLHDLCTKHNVLDLYIWLHFRYPLTFPEAVIARAQKSRCIDLIARALQADIRMVGGADDAAAGKRKETQVFKYPRKPKRKSEGTPASKRTMRMSRITTEPRQHLLAATQKMKDKVSSAA